MIQAYDILLVLIITRPENGEARPPHHLTQRRQKPGTRNFFKNIGAVATLGAGLAFSLILSTLQDPKEASIWKLLDLRTVRILLAVSWFLFMLTLALSFTIGSNKHTKASVWKTLYLLDIAAVACLSIVVAAYVEVVGFTGAVFAIVFGIVVILD